MLEKYLNILRSPILYTLRTVKQWSVIKWGSDLLLNKGDVGC